MKGCGLKVVILANFHLPNGCFISQTSLELHIVLITGIFSNIKYDVTFTYDIMIVSIFYATFQIDLSTTIIGFGNTGDMPQKA